MGKTSVMVAAGATVVVCAAAAVIVGKRVKSLRNWIRAVSVVMDFQETCETSVANLRRVVDALSIEMHAGLVSERCSKLKMLLSFVDNLPNGSERGTFYALHVGGTDYRILRVELRGQRSSLQVQEVERQPVPRCLMIDTRNNLFDYLASSLQQFVEREVKDSESSHVKKRELGFTFSFPVKQTSISSGFLIKWTKGFAISEMVGKEVTGCLQQSLNGVGVDMHTAVLVNDTVGALAHGHYYDVDTVAAVIIGTGTNACYLERTDAIIKCRGLLPTSGSMVINTEWGNFRSPSLPRTSYDVDLDEESPNPKDMVFEKMISGMYLGDIVRRVILRMSQESNIFGPVSPSLLTPFILKTPSISEMREDDTPDLTQVARILEAVLGIEKSPLKARKLIVKICDVVTRRAARLAAAGIVGILKRMGRDGSRGGITIGRSRSDVKMQRTVVVIGGGLYTNYLTFRDYLREAVVEILGEEIAQYVELKESEDGPGLGAALLAASHMHLSSVDTAVQSVKLESI